MQLPDNFSVVQVDGQLIAESTPKMWENPQRTADRLVFIPIIASVAFTFIAGLAAFASMVRGNLFFALILATFFIAGMWVVKESAPDGRISGLIHKRALGTIWEEPFYLQSPGDTVSAGMLGDMLVNALKHDSFKLEARAIVEAGLIGFQHAATTEGRIEVSRQIKGHADKLAKKMEESDDQRDADASEATRMYLEGFQ